MSCHGYLILLMSVIYFIFRSLARESFLLADQERRTGGAGRLHIALPSATVGCAPCPPVVTSHVLKLLLYHDGFPIAWINLHPHLYQGFSSSFNLRDIVIVFLMRQYNRGNKEWLVRIIGSGFLGLWSKFYRNEEDDVMISIKAYWQHQQTKSTEDTDCFHHWASPTSRTQSWVHCYCQLMLLSSNEPDAWCVHNILRLYYYSICSICREYHGHFT